MFGVFDAGVNALHREVIGPVALDTALVPGQWRELTAEEVNAPARRRQTEKIEFHFIISSQTQPDPVRILHRAGFIFN